MERRTRFQDCIAWLLLSIASASHADSGTDFLEKLKQLSERGDLFDPAAAERILEMGLAAQTREIQLSNCPGRRNPREVTTKVIAADSHWYKPLASGVGEVTLPAIAINPATTSGPTHFSYEIVQRVDCPDWTGLADNVKSRIEFSGLPAFACIKENDIRVAIPQAHYRLATDGYSGWGHSARTGEESSTYLHFTFRYGTPCALSVEVSQEKSDGLRFRRAEARYLICRVGAEKTFCERFPLASWVAEATLREHVDRVCGSLDSLYQTEPLTGALPGPRPPSARGRDGPCDPNKL